MPFNGSGTFTRDWTWVGDATAGIKIKADRHDIMDDDFAGGISKAICKDGQSIVGADIPWNGKKITNLANPVNPQDAVTFATFKAGLMDRFASAAADMSMLFRTATNRLVINDKADGTGTDVLTFVDGEGTLSTRTMIGTSGQWTIFDPSNIGRFSLYANFSNDTTSLSVSNSVGTLIQRLDISGNGVNLSTGTAAGAVLTEGNVCYKGAASDNQVFPIGSTVFVYSDGGGGLNSTNNAVGVYLTNNPNFSYLTTGTYALSGTWVSRGFVINGTIYSCLCQRVA